MWIIEGTAGDPDASVSASELTAYSNANSKPEGDRTAEEQATVAAVESKVANAALEWNALQAAAQAEILTRTAEIQANMARQIRKAAKPGRERALLEMFSVVTRANGELIRDVVELRARVEALEP